MCSQTDSMHAELLIIMLTRRQKYQNGIFCTLCIDQTFTVTSTPTLNLALLEYVPGLSSLRGLPLIFINNPNVASSLVGLGLWAKRVRLAIIYTADQCEQRAQPALTRSRR